MLYLRCLHSADTFGALTNRVDHSDAKQEQVFGTAPSRSGTSGHRLAKVTPPIDHFQLADENRNIRHRLLPRQPFANVVPTDLQRHLFLLFLLS